MVNQINNQTLKFFVFVKKNITFIQNKVELYVVKKLPDGKIGKKTHIIYKKATIFIVDNSLCFILCSIKLINKYIKNKAPIKPCSLNIS